MRCNIKTLSKMLIVLLLASFMALNALCFTSCGTLSDEDKQNIIDTFDGFNNKEGVVLRHADKVFTRDSTIDLNEVYFNNNQCHVLSCAPDMIYAYSYVDEDNDTNLYLLEVGYDGNILNSFKFIENVSHSDIKDKFVYGQKIYFGLGNGPYYVFDTLGQTIGKINSSEAEEIKTVKDSSELYDCSIKSDIAGDDSVIITKKSTNENVKIVRDDLRDFTEGQYILSLDTTLTRPFFRKATEKFGNIYLLGAISLDPVLGLEWQYVVFEYNFAENALSYYTSIHVQWDEEPQLYIF